VIFQSDLDPGKVRVLLLLPAAGLFKVFPLKSNHIYLYITVSIIGNILFKMILAGWICMLYSIPRLVNIATGLGTVLQYLIITMVYSPFFA